MTKKKKNELCYLSTQVLKFPSYYTPLQTLVKDKKSEDTIWYREPSYIMTVGCSAHKPY